MRWSLLKKDILLDRPCEIAVINVAPDSFSDGGEFLAPEDALAQARKMLALGAKVLDIGAESTRPGSQPIEPMLEWERLAPALKLIRSECPDCQLSIDTRNPEVAEKALGLGADIVNDVAGFRDPRMLALASESACGLIAMRIRLFEGRIQMPDYLDRAPKKADAAIEELIAVKDRLLGAGISGERILLDPGFGFGTTCLEDCAIWESLPGLPDLLKWPIQRFCLGISRKRFVACHFGVAEKEQLDEKTAELHKIAINIGYKVFRTHSAGRLPDGP
jgi:dihydropteroate synthase